METIYKNLEVDPIGKFKKCETMENGNYKITWERFQNGETRTEEIIVDSKKMEGLIEMFNSLGRSFKKVMNVVAIKMEKDLCENGNNNL